VDFVSPVRRGVKSDASAVAQRVADQLLHDARLEPLVSPDLPRADFESSLAASQSPFWVDDANGHLRGHLYGATFADPLHGRQTWTGPDGFSFDNEDVLDDLLRWAHSEWRDDGSLAHLVWALAGHGTQPWVERGYRVASVRGSRVLDEVEEPTWPAGQRLRLGTPADLEAALDFDAMIDEAQGLDPAALSDAQRAAGVADVSELLEDPDTRYFILEVDGRPGAQCVTYRLPSLRGNFEDTIYLGSLAVRPELRRRGLAGLLVAAALADARREGFGHAEVRWHIDNHAATALWSALGFQPTYVQLRTSLSLLRVVN